MVLTAPNLGGTTVGKVSHLRSLTGMRFIAALMVFFFHAQYMNLFASTEAQASYHSLFGQGGWTGVGFFFVLSGFVLTWSARNDDSAGGFWRRRLFKIYPNHVVMFVVAYVLCIVVAQQVINNGHALLNLFLLQAWSPYLEVNQTVNTVSWSLSCELLFYLSFPLLFRWISRIRAERLWKWAAGVVAAIFAVPLIANLLPADPFLPWAGMSESQLWFIYFFPPVRLLDFVFGIIVARMVMTGRRIPLGLGGAVALAVAAYAVAPLVPGGFHLVAVTIVPLGLVIAAGAVADTAGQATFLGSRPMVWLGEVSFAFYMVHYQLQANGVILFGLKPTSTGGALATLALLFAATLLAAWLLYTLVERPMMRRFAKPRKQRRLAGVE